jgi:DNA-binding XRE family transcriptional regulator
MIDLNLLKETLKSRGYTQEKMAKSLGITTYTLNRKLLGVFDFKGREMNQIAAMMKLSRKEICDIFFADERA